MFYSIPYDYIKKKVDVRLTRTMVEVFLDGKRIASHVRKHGYPGQYSTLPEHMPENHHKYTQWNAERFLSWARGMGENTVTVVKAILASRKIEQQGYRLHGTSDPAIASLSFADRLGLLVDAEWSARRSRKLTRLIRGAQLHAPSACVEDIKYHADCKLDKALIAKLSTCTYIQDRHDIIILGASGAEKTYMARPTKNHNNTCVCIFYIIEFSESNTAFANAYRK